MGFRDSIFVFAATGHLALALLSASRIGKSVLARPLALLAFALFGWTFATFGNHLASGSPIWRALDLFFTALTPPLVLYLVVAFAGLARARRRALRAVLLAFGAFALASAFGALSGAASWVESPVWAAVFLTAWLPTLAYELWLLVAHLRAATDADEQMRARLLLAAILVGGAFGATDLLGDLGFGVPGLAPLGSLVSAALVAVVALRFRLFDRAPGAATALYAVAIAVASILGYLTLFQHLRGALPALLFGVTALTLLLAVLVREATASHATHRERIERLAVLGRFSAQMAHDLKNPLAALVGAAQVLEIDGAHASPREREFLALILDQAKRMREVVDRYERLGRVEPAKTLVRPNELVTRVTALQRFAAPEGLTLRLDLDAALGTCDLDADLVAGALENLVRNAVQASRPGGAVVVGTRLEASLGGAPRMLLWVADEGEGMDVRHKERAFDDFHTTRSDGTGLGLPFVRRVALAHGGDASITSQLGRGTRVEIRIPTG